MLQRIEFLLTLTLPRFKVQNPLVEESFALVEGFGPKVNLSGLTLALVSLKLLQRFQPLIKRLNELLPRLVSRLSLDLLKLLLHNQLVAGRLLTLTPFLHGLRCCKGLQSHVE